MNVDTLPGNSHTSKAATAPPRVPKPAVVHAVVAKEPLGKKFKKAFFSDESGMGDRILREVVVPAIKTGLFGMLTGIVGSLFWGVSNGGGYGGYSYSPYNRWGGYQRPIYTATPQGYTNYAATSTPQPPRTSQQASPTDIIFTSRADAELVRDSLGEILVTYHVVTLADYFETCGVPVNGATDYNVGWTDLSQAKIKEQNGGWALVLPRPTPIMR